MKKIILISAVVALTACSGKASNADGDSATQDSAASVTTATSSTNAITDAMCLDAKGNIASMEVSTKQGLYESIMTYTFDDKGHLVRMEDGQITDMGPDDIKLERDADGRPTKLTMSVTDEFDEPQDYSISFTYDASGNLIKEQHESYDSSWTTTYTLDSTGKATVMTVADPFGSSEKTNFTYPDATDTHGNWTKRVTTDAGGEQTTVTRKFTYRD